MCIDVASRYIERGNSSLLVVFRQSKTLLLKFPSYKTDQWPVYTRWASPVSWVSLAHALFPRNIFVVFTACRWSIRDFEVARETWTRWLSKCIVGLFWGTHFQHGGKFVPQNSPTMHFDNHLRPGLQRNLKVGNKSRFSQFATLKTRRKLDRGSFRKDFWDRY